MKLNMIKKSLRLFVLMLLASCGILNAQQLEIDYDSHPTVAGAQLQLNEIGDADDWVRLWMQNNSDLANYWALTARPQAGLTDVDGIVDSPFAFSYSGTQKFAVGNDGLVRINKQFTLPNMDGINGQVFKTDGAGVVNFDWVHYSEKTSTFDDPVLRLHTPIDGNAHITFSNGGFLDNRWAITADPSGSNAEMKFSWGNTTNPSLVEEYLTFGFDGSEPYTRSDMRLGLGTMPYYSGTNGFRLHVVSADEPAAHFGEQSASNPANGYVTVNKPTTYSSDIILKLRDNGSTKVDFQTDEAEFYVEALFREDVRLVTADLVVGGDVTIDDLLIIEPRATNPTCDAGGANNGSVIFYSNGATKKLRVCVDGSWEDLN